MGLCYGIRQQEIVDQFGRELYDRIGGQQAVKIIVENFHKNVLADERIKFLFAKNDMERFLSVAFGGPNWTGTSVASYSEVYNWKHPTGEQFDALVENLASTVKDLEISPEDSDEMVKIYQSFKSAVLGLEKNEAKTTLEEKKVEVTIEPERHPDLTASVLNKAFNDPAYGILKLLEGTWVNYSNNDGKMNYGLMTICMPSPGTNSETIPGIFHFLCQNYTEELTFTCNPYGVRNRGGTNDMMVGAVNYQTAIRSERGKSLHAENGMYLWMNNLFNNSASVQSISENNGWPQQKPGDEGPVFMAESYTIARIGTIPHGQSICLLGNNQPWHDGKPSWPEGVDTWNLTTGHLAVSKQMGATYGPINLDEPAPEWVHSKELPTKDPFGNRTYTQRIIANEFYPYSVRPDLRLRDTIKDQKITGYQYIELNSELNEGQGYQGGIINAPFVYKYAPVQKMTHRIWLETVEETDENGKVQKIQQLQYEQVMNFVFMFGTDGGQTIWPHITVNTLRRKKTNRGFK